MSLVGPSAVVPAVVRKLMNIKWIVELVALGWHLARGGLSPWMFCPASLDPLASRTNIFIPPTAPFGRASYAAFLLFPSCAFDLTAPWKKTLKKQLEPVAEQQLKAPPAPPVPQSDGPGYEGELH
jgi:hypothetical protein